MSPTPDAMLPFALPGTGRDSKEFQLPQASIPTELSHDEVHV